MRKLTYLVALILMVGLYALRQNQKPVPLTQPKVSETGANSPAPNILTPSEKVIENKVLAKMNGASVAKATTPLDEELQTLVKDEAAQMDRVEQSGPEAQLRLREIVKKLTNDRAHQLARQAMKLTVPINERALSTYLLVESGALGGEALEELIKAPLEKPGPYPPHSIDELQSMQEKSLRIMGIDGLFQQAKTDLAAQQRLATIAQTAESESIRNYASRKLSELN